MPIKSLTFVSSNEEKYREIRGALSGCGVTVTRAALDGPGLVSELGQELVSLLDLFNGQSRHVVCLS